MHNEYRIKCANWILDRILDESRGYFIWDYEDDPIGIFESFSGAWRYDLPCEIQDSLDAICI